MERGYCGSHPEDGRDAEITHRKQWVSALTDNPRAPSGRRSIKRQPLSELIVCHRCEFVLRINLLRIGEEELVKRLKRTRTQRIDNTRQSDLGKKRLGAWDGHDFEVVRKDPRPIRNEVMPGEGYVRITTCNHLGEIAMHDAEPSQKARHLGGEQGVGTGLAKQCFGGLAALIANVPRIR